MEKDNQEIDLWEYWNILKKRKKLIMILTLAGTMASIIYSLILPRMYEAKASIMPISGSSSGSFLGGALGSFLPISSLSHGNEKFMAFLKSRSLAVEVIRKMNLMPVLFKEQWDPAGKSWKTGQAVPRIEDGAAKLKGLVRVEADPIVSTLNVMVEFENPQMAALIVNQYTKSLQDFIDNNNLTREKRERVFLEEQLRQSKMKFLSASRELGSFFETNAVSSIKPVVDVDLGSTNPPFQETSLNALDQQVKELEEQTSKMKQQLIVKAVPAQLYLNYLMQYVQVLSALNQTLEQQVAFAKFKEAKKDLAFHVIDPALPDPSPVKPRRKAIVILSTLAFFLISIVICFTVEYVHKIRLAHIQK